MSKVNQQTRDKWDRTGRLLRSRSPNHKRKSIDEMSLSEALDAEQKFLVWSKKYPKHEEIEVKTHIYEKYLIPRIKHLKENHVVEPVKTNIKVEDYVQQEIIDPNEKYIKMTYQDIKKLEDKMSQWLIFHKSKSESKKWKTKKAEYDLVSLWMNKKMHW